MQTDRPHLPSIDTLCYSGHRWVSVQEDFSPEPTGYAHYHDRATGEASFSYPSSSPSINDSYTNVHDLSKYKHESEHNANNTSTSKHRSMKTHARYDARTFKLANQARTVSQDQRSLEDLLTAIELNEFMSSMYQQKFTHTHRVHPYLADHSERIRSLSLYKTRYTYTISEPVRHHLDKTRNILFH